MTHVKNDEVTALNVEMILHVGRQNNGQ